MLRWMTSARVKSASTCLHSHTIPLKDLISIAFVMKWPVGLCMSLCLRAYNLLLNNWRRHRAWKCMSCVLPICNNKLTKRLFLCLAQGPCRAGCCVPALNGRERKEKGAGAVMGGKNLCRGVIRGVTSSHRLASTWLIAGSLFCCCCWAVLRFQTPCKNRWSRSAETAGCLWFSCFHRSSLVVAEQRTVERRSFTCLSFKTSSGFWQEWYHRAQTPLSPC